MGLKDALKHPLTGLALIVSAVGQLGFALFDPAWALLSSTANLWFPALATLGATVLPEVGFESLGTSVLLGGALVYVGVKVDKLIDELQSRIQNR